MQLLEMTKHSPTEHLMLSIAMGGVAFVTGSTTVREQVPEMLTRARIAARTAINER